MATLTLRIPQTILHELERSASESGRTIEAEVIEILEHERVRRVHDQEFERRLAELNERTASVEMSSAEWQAFWDEMREERDNRPPLDLF